MKLILKCALVTSICLESRTPSESAHVRGDLRFKVNNTSCLYLNRDKEINQASQREIAQLFKPVSVKLREKCNIPIFLPKYFGNENEPAPLYASITEVEMYRYQVVLGFSEGCEGGNACRWGTVLGEKAKTKQMVKGRKVNLINGILGYYEKSICGANCSDTKITWFANGNKYVVGIKSANLKKVIKMANSAIEAGPI